MIHVHDILRRRLLIRAGVLEPVTVTVATTLAELRESEWSPRFEKFMRNRLIMGAFRYERFETKRRSFNYACATEAILRIERYQKDGNTEHLVDAANMCLLEFEFGCHPKKHFASVDDGVHAQKL